MKVLETIPEVGTVIDWDLDEITSRMSGDLPSYVNRANRERLNIGSNDYSREPRWISRTDKNIDPELIVAGWEKCLKSKREDWHYEDIVDSLRENGFVRPINAYTEDGELRICDGHHRIAAALELGFTSVPVMVHEEIKIAQDSGSWNRERPISQPAEDDNNDW